MNKILATGLLGLALVSAIPAVAADSKADKTWFDFLRSWKLPK